MTKNRGKNNAEHHIRVPDVQGSYSIRYIQSSTNLHIRLSFAKMPDECVDAAVVLRSACLKHVLSRVAVRESPICEYRTVPRGEYELTIESHAQSGNLLFRSTYTPIGIGTVIAALGDSLTEGYHGRGYMRDELDLRAEYFPDTSVSKDRRNYPQFAPTTAIHKPSVNCFQSFMPRLNDGLSESWRHPVFIGNEGWGGYTTRQYLEMMTSGHHGWRERMFLLKPTVWLVHLGVNDERQHISPDEFYRNYLGIIEILCRDFGAATDNIHIAYPSFDYWPGAIELLRKYIDCIDVLIERCDVRRGPDFFSAFAKDRQKWYGDDPVHPRQSGMDRMADMWLEALGDHPPRTDEVEDVPVITIPG